MLSVLTSKVESLSKKGQLILASILICLTSCICFCSGVSRSDTVIEKKSVEIAEFADKYSSTNYISVQVSPTNEEAKKSLPSTYNEYFYWKYIFRHSDFSFLSTVNGGKTHECHYKEIENSNNISFLYCGNNFNHEYQGYYKHEVYDIMFMFKGKHSINKDAINFFAISKTRAIELLKKRGATMVDSDFAIEQYESLLGTNTTLLLDNQSFEFTISNIYFEDGDFYLNVSNNFGEFTISYIYFPDFLEMESTYIFNKYVYQNSHKIQRMRSLFTDENYHFTMSNFTINEDGIKKSIDYDFNDLFKTKIGDDMLSIILTVLAFLLLAFALAVFWLSNKTHHLSSYLIIALSFLAPYLLLALINLFKATPLLFSYYSLKIYIVQIVIFLITSIIILLKKGGRKIRKKL